MATGGVHAPFCRVAYIGASRSRHFWNRIPVYPPGAVDPNPVGYNHVRSSRVCSCTSSNTSVILCTFGNSRLPYVVPCLHPNRPLEIERGEKLPRVPGGPQPLINGHAKAGFLMVIIPVPPRLWPFFFPESRHILTLSWPGSFVVSTAGFSSIYYSMR